MFGNFSITSLAIIPVLGLLIFVHELGHFLAARWMGVRVHEFGFGYPPRMIKLFTRNGVDYTLNWLPFGGFVRMAGEDSDFDDPQALPNVAPWRRMVVMAAGSFMNIVTAILLFAFLFWVGVPEYVGNPDEARVQIIAVAPDTPAADAGLQAGDIIVAIDSDELLGVSAVSESISTRAGVPLVMEVTRGETPLSVSFTPRLPEDVPPGQGASGIQISTYVSDGDMELVRYGPIQAIIAGFQRTVNLIMMMIEGLATLLRGLISPNVPTPEGGIGGVVAIGRIAAEVAQQGWRDLINLTAFLSINLAILNMLPIPALDGGRIIFALVEMVRRKRIPPEKEALVHFAGFALLIAFMAFVTFVDVSNWVAGRPALPGG